MPLKANRQVFKVAVIYVIAAGCLGVFSDVLLKKVITNPNQRIDIDIFKDCGLGILTGALLYLILRRWQRQWEKEAEQRQQGEIARQESVDQLCHSEEQLRMILEASNDGLWDWNLKSGVAKLSPRYWEIIGYTEGEVVADMALLRRVIHPEDWPLVVHKLDEHFAGKVALCAGEYRMITKDGTEIWTWIRGKVVVRAADGSPLRMVGAIADISKQKMAAKEMKRLSQWLLKTQQLSKVGGWTINLKTGVVWASPESYRIYGAAASELSTLPSIRSFPLPQDHHRLDAALRELIADQHPYDIEFQIKRGNDGAIMDIHSMAEYNEEESLVIGVIEDITQRKRTEHEIQRQAAFARFNPNPVMELSATGEIMYFNAATLEMACSFGQKDPSGILPPDTAAVVRDCLAYSKPRLRLETQIQNRTISWSYFPVALNQVVHCYAGDITERKRAEEQMNLQSSALTAAANAIAITDRNGEIEWVNPSFIKLTGYSAAEVIGKTLRVVKSGQNSQNFYANLWATIVAGNVWHGELINRHKNGRLYTEDMTITSVRGADGQIAHFVAIKQDVTERREFENRLQQAQKMEAIGTLAGGIAHDFNNILAIMFGNAGLLQRDLMENPSAQESINEILNAANRAKDLVQQILTFSRRREHNRQTIRLYTVVKEAVKFLRASLPANIKIETNLAAEAPRVLADPTQIYQVAVNLGTNALHAMEGQSGRLVVSLDTFQPDEKFIQAHPGIQPIPHARLTFADTGHGIDAKTLERIFEPFFTTKPVGQGTGLGLAVVHGIVQSHQGVITVESQPGQGTTFCVYFPARADAVALTDSPDVNFDPGHGEHILLLDDEPSLTLVFKLHLLRLNYQVTVSNNARETINLFRQNPAQFDLFITDLTMPEMNGLEVARQVHLIRPDLPIVLASGFAPDLTQMNLRDAGIRELLQKPVSLTTLNKLLARFFDKSVRPI